jgi:hypothetical protein
MHALGIPGGFMVSTSWVVGYCVPARQIDKITNCIDGFAADSPADSKFAPKLILHHPMIFESEKEGLTNLRLKQPVPSVWQTIPTAA